MAHHLTKQERDRIAQLSHQRYQQKEIAESIGRSPSTIKTRTATTGNPFSGGGASGPGGGKTPSQTQIALVSQSATRQSKAACGWATGKETRSSVRQARAAW